VARGARACRRAGRAVRRCGDGVVNAPRILVDDDGDDAMLDRCWDGVVDRISTEAPVLVRRVARGFERPDGVANVAALGVARWA